MYPTKTRVADHVNIGKVKAVLIALIDSRREGKKERKREGRKEQVLGTCAIGKDYFAYVIYIFADTAEFD